MAKIYLGGVSLKIDAKTGFMAIGTGADYGAEEAELIASDLAYYAGQEKTLVQAFVPDAKADKVTKIKLKSGNDFAISGFKPVTIEKLLISHTPRILVNFAGRAPMPYLAFFAKTGIVETKSPFGRRS